METVPFKKKVKESQFEVLVSPRKPMDLSIVILKNEIRKEKTK
jgi:hypothetical protein